MQASSVEDGRGAMTMVDDVDDIVTGQIASM